MWNKENKNKEPFNYIIQVVEVCDKRWTAPIQILKENRWGNVKRWSEKKLETKKKQRKEKLSQIWSRYLSTYLWVGGNCSIAIEWIVLVQFSIFINRLLLFITIGWITEGQIKFLQLFWAPQINNIHHTHHHTTTHITTHIPPPNLSQTSTAMYNQWKKNNFKFK